MSELQVLSKECIVLTSAEGVVLLGEVGSVYSTVLPT